MESKYSAEKLNFLLQNCKQAECCHELYVYLAPKMRRYLILSFGKDVPVRDVLHNVFVKLIGSEVRGDYRSPIKMFARACSNQCIDLLRRRGRTVEFRLEDFRDNSEYSYSFEERFLASDALDFYLGRLKPLDRKIIVLHDIVGLKHCEIAKKLGINVNTVKQNYSRAIKFLKKTHRFAEMEEELR